MHKHTVRLEKLWKQTNKSSKRKDKAAEGRLKGKVYKKEDYWRSFIALLQHITDKIIRVNKNDNIR